MHKPRIALVWQILIGLLAGIAIGALLHRFPESRPWLVNNLLQPAGDIFIKLMKMIVSSLLPLAKLIMVSYVSIAFFVLVVLNLVARLCGINLFALMRHIKDELILAFSTASSAAVMPQLMKKLETYGVPPSLVSFVVPVGYSFNLDGASLFLGIGTLFVAQLYGIDLSLGDQALLVVTMVLTSKGAAGVPGFMFVILSATLASAGLPLEGIAFIAGVYRLMEMPTTALNVLGNALAPLVIAKWERRVPHTIAVAAVEP